LPAFSSRFLSVLEGTLARRVKFDSIGSGKRVHAGAHENKRSAPVCIIGQKRSA